MGAAAVMARPELSDSLALVLALGVGSKTMKARSSRSPPSNSRRACSNNWNPWAVCPFRARPMSGSLVR